MRIRTVLLAAILSGRGDLFCQNTVSPTEPPNSAVPMVASVRNMVVAPVTGQPFTGRDIVMWTHHGFGKGKTFTAEDKVARNSRGQVYRETHLFNQQSETTGDLIAFTLVDPIGGTYAICTAADHRCLVRAIPKGTVNDPEARRTYDSMLHSEPLDDKQIDGLAATGKRESRSYESVRLRNGAPLPVTPFPMTCDSWYSSELEATLELSFKDPDSGTRTYHLTILDRTEPDPAIFQVPEGYKLYRVPSSTPDASGNRTAPQVLFAPEPEFSEEARKARIGGNVMVSVVVDESGNSTDVQVVRGIGHGLDEKAVEAVQKYRFKPATKDGVPVSVKMTISVNFQIYGKP